MSRAEIKKEIKRLEANLKTYKSANNAFAASGDTNNMLVKPMQDMEDQIAKYKQMLKGV